MKRDSFRITIVNHVKENARAEHSYAPNAWLEHTTLIAREGVIWIRGWHADDAPEVQAMRAAWVLERR